MNLYVLDLLGVFAFAFFGARSAIQVRASFLLIVTCGFLTAVGGGTVRQFLIHSQPGYMHDPRYLIVIALGMYVAALWYRQFTKFSKYMYILDCIGLVTFAYIGAMTALQAQTHSIFVYGSALLTTFGGGIVSNLLTGQYPQIFRSYLYIIPVLLIAGWAIISTPQPSSLTATFLLLCALAIYYATIHAQSVLKYLQKLQLLAVKKGMVALTTETKE